MKVCRYITLSFQYLWLESGGGGVCAGVRNFEAVYIEMLFQVLEPGWNHYRRQCTRRKRRGLGIESWNIPTLVGRKGERTSQGDQKGGLVTAEGTEDSDVIGGTLHSSDKEMSKEGWAHLWGEIMFPCQVGWWQKMTIRLSTSPWGVIKSLTHEVILVGVCLIEATGKVSKENGRKASQLETVRVSDT